MTHVKLNGVPHISVPEQQLLAESGHRAMNPTSHRCRLTRLEKILVWLHSSGAGFIVYIALSDHQDLKSSHQATFRRGSRVGYLGAGGRRKHSRKLSQGQWLEFESAR